jgi:rRNA processing protein Krr1/Pno1
MVNICKRAVESLLGGSPHANVYKWLERQRRLLKKRSFEEGGF